MPSILLFVGVVERLNATRPTLGAEIAYGFTAYCVIWWGLLKRSRISFFSTLEHELIHALFAVLTLHRVTSIRATFLVPRRRQGSAMIGEMKSIGSGNWLISISPYFFPGATVVICLLIPFFHNILTEYTNCPAAALFGFSLAYHFFSTWNAIHRHQQDLKEVGFLFATAFLPCANIVAITLCLVWFNEGIGEAIRHIGKLWSLTF